MSLITVGHKQSLYEGIQYTELNSSISEQLKPYLSFDSHGTIKYAVHAENSWLWWIDDGCTHQWAKHTTIANSECPTIHVLYSQVTFLCLHSRT